MERSASNQQIDQRLRIEVEKAIDEARRLEREVAGIAQRLPLSERGHVAHLRSIADRLDLLSKALESELRSESVGADEVRHLSMWGQKVAAGFLAVAVLVGHGAITRTGEIGAELLIRTLDDVVQTSEQPATPSDQLAAAIVEARRESGQSAQDVAEQLGFSRQFLSAVENGRALLAEDKLEHFISLMSLDETRSTELRDLQRAARNTPTS